MKFFTKLIFMACLSSIILGISACGKVSSPVPIEGSGYPHTYPRH